MPLIRDAKTGKWVEYDKKKSCKNCPDRTVEPNCHGYCKEYIERTEEQRLETERLKEAKARENAPYVHFRSVKAKIRKAQRNR